MSEIITDPTALDAFYLPPDLPGREEELARMKRIFQSVVEAVTSRNAHIYGIRGTGKTVLARRFTTTLSQRHKDIDVEYVSCKRMVSIRTLVEMIVSRYAKFNHDVSADRMLASMTNHLANQRRKYIVILDEAHHIFEDDQKEADQFLFSLIRASECYLKDGGARKEASISLILIGKENLLDKMDPSTRRTFGSQIIALDPYKWKQLERIVDQRVKLALSSNAITDEDIELIARIAEPTGSATRALELLETAARIAESDERDEYTITAEDIRRAKVEVEPELRAEIFEHLDNHIKYTMLGILKNTGTEPFLPMKDAYEAYQKECEIGDVKPNGRNQHRRYVGKLEEYGVVERKMDRHKRFIYFDEVPDKFIAALEGMIARDKEDTSISCPSRR